MTAPPVTTEADPAACATEVTRVLVVDDHPAVHLGLAVLMSTAGGIELVATAATGQEGVRKFVEEAPDVVILDLTMPDQTGLVTLRQMLDHDPDALVLVLTASAVAEDVVEAVRSGAAGYLLKDTGGAELVAASGRSGGGGPGRRAAHPRSRPDERAVAAGPADATRARRPAAPPGRASATSRSDCGWASTRRR